MRILTSCTYTTCIQPAPPTARLKVKCIMQKKRWLYSVWLVGNDEAPLQSTLPANPLYDRVVKDDLDKKNTVTPLLDQLLMEVWLIVNTPLSVLYMRINLQTPCVILGSLNSLRCWGDKWIENFSTSANEYFRLKALEEIPQFRSIMSLCKHRKCKK